MKVVLKSLFLALTLAILSYSAVAAGADSLIAIGDTAARQCCTYQVDCPEDQECKLITPDCSADKPHICKKAAAEDIEPETATTR